MVTYKNGDIFKSSCNLIGHQVNCQGVMGSGIAKTIRERYPQAYNIYMYKHKEEGSHLGDISAATIPGSGDEIMGDLHIVNMYAQDKYLPRGICHTNYDAFRKCLQKIKYIITFGGEWPLAAKGWKIGFPDHIGCGLAGGDWNIVKQIIEDEFSGDEWDVEVWKLNS